MKKQICVYAGLVLDIDTLFCPACKEYDGLMPLNKETLEYLGEDLEGWQEDYQIV